MPQRDQLLAALVGDPLALYPALAALLLVSVALASGLMRGDVLALARPAPVAWMALALAVTYGATSLIGAVGEALHAELLTGMARAPLYVFALAYGAVPALVAAALAGAYLPAPAAAPWGPYLLALELIVIGWLAVWPSPRRSRWAAPLYTLMGFALAAGTAGIATLALGGAHVDLGVVVAHHGAVPLGVVAAALLLVLVPPATFERLFVDSRIAPSRVIGTAVAARASADDVAAAPADEPPAAPPTPMPAHGTAPFQRPPRRRERPAPVEIHAEPFSRRTRRGR